MKLGHPSSEKAKQGEENYLLFLLSVAHRALAAFLAISFRCSELIFSIRPWALFFPPSRPSATAAGFFFFAIDQPF